jgi:hemoglobin-like flavoprotein
MNEDAITRVQDSFALVVPIKEAAAEIFYADLFETAPEVKPYFANTDMTEQGAKLMKTLGTVVAGLRYFDQIAPVAAQLAVKHVDYGVKREDYAKVGASLLRTLEKGLGDEFTPDVKAAWITAYGAVSSAMIDAAYTNAPAGL